jgi:ATP-binding cassette, subfamily B, multidrug efflux pump
MNEEHFELTADVLKTKIYDKNLISKLLKYLGPYKGYLLISFTLLLMLTAIELTLPLIIKTAVDDHIVPSRNLISFDNREDFEAFRDKYRRAKFTPYERGNNYFLMFPTDNKNHIHADDLEKLQEKGRYTEDNYLLVKNSPEVEEILEGKEYVILSEELIAVTQDTVEQLEKSEIRKVRGHSRNSLFYFGLFFLALTVIRFVVNYYQVYVTNFAAQKAMFDLRRDAFVHMEKMPLSFFDKNPVGRLVTRVTTDIRALDELLSQGMVTMLQDVLILIGIIIVMLFLNWRLALVSFTLLPFVFLLVRHFKNKTRIIYREVRKKIAMLNASLAEDISGLKIIQLFNRYEVKFRQFARINQGYYDASMEQLRLFAIFRPLISISRHVAIAIILWYGGGQIIRDTLSLGMLMAFIRYMERFFEPVNHLSEQFNLLQAAMSGAERVFDLMAKKTQDYRDKFRKKIKIKGDVEFKNVWLTYNPESSEPEYVLKDINLKIKAGEKVALVGHTGSGKTSTVNLIGEMYPFQKGDITIDGKSIKDYSVANLRNNIGIVQQDVFLFSGTIKDNIVLNNDSLSDEEIERIAGYVNVDRFVNKMPLRYYEPVMERGATLSVGQRQLIAFARVLAFDPAIFILDEATSNIDTETEILIQDALQKVMANRTSIIIAHRLSTIQNADRIVVMHKGKIIEQGNHNELLNNKSLYYDLYRLQYS